MGLSYRLLLLVLSSALASEFVSENVYDGYKVYDIKPKSEEDLKFLKNLDSVEGDKRSLDFLSFHNSVNDVVRLMVKPDEQNYIEDLFKAENVDYKVTVENIQK